MLAGVAEDVRTACALAGQARTGLDDAVSVLAALGEQNSQPLPPPQLRRAVDELARGLGLMYAGLDKVSDIATRL